MKAGYAFQQNLRTKSADPPTRELRLKTNQLSFLPPIISKPHNVPRYNCSSLHSENCEHERTSPFRFHHIFSVNINNNAIFPPSNTSSRPFYYQSSPPPKPLRIMSAIPPLQSNMLSPSLNLQQQLLPRPILPTPLPRNTRRTNMRRGTKTLP